MSFYVTLPSHANRHEFPNNQANSFKIRLPLLTYVRIPYRIRTSICTSWCKKMGTSCRRPGTKPTPNRVEKTGKRSGEETAHKPSSMTFNIWIGWWIGVSFMKATIAHLEQRRKETAIQGGRFTNDQGKHRYVKFRWEGEDLIIDNTNVCHCKTDTPALYIYTKLAVKMGWLRKISSGLILGPNLQQDFMGDQIPNMTKPVDNDWNDVDDDQHNPSFGRCVPFHRIIYD